MGFEERQVASGVVLGATTLLLAWALGSLAAFRRHHGGLPLPARADHREHSLLLHHLVRQWWHHQATPVVAAMVRRGWSPNALTCTCLGFSVAAGALFATGWTAAGGLVLLLGGAADSLDGRLARESGKASKRGAFLDSTLDRLGELLVFLGLAIHFHGTWLVYVIAAGLGASMMVSYARARGLSLGVDFDGGVMQRPERIVYLGTAGMVDPLVQAGQDAAGYVPSPVFLAGVVVVVCVLSLGTAVHRILAIFRRL